MGSPQTNEFFDVPKFERADQAHPVAALSGETLNSTDMSRAHSPAAANKEVEGLGFPKVQSEAELVRDIHKAEDHYVFDHNNSEPFGEQRRASLQQVWRGTQAFADKNPDQVRQLVSDLQRQDLLPQLAIAALDQALGDKEGAGKPFYSLTKDEAVGLIDRQDGLGKAIKNHLSHAFTVQAGEGFGGGYADTTKSTSNGSYRPNDAAISQHHLDGLMRDFSHPPDYLSTEAQEAKDRQPAGFLSKIFSWR